jgi:hypothetical protein
MKLPAISGYDAIKKELWRELSKMQPNRRFGAVKIGDFHMPG